MRTHAHMCGQQTVRCVGVGSRIPGMPGSYHFTSQISFLSGDPHKSTVFSPLLFLRLPVISPFLRAPVETRGAREAAAAGGHEPQGLLGQLGAVPLQLPVRLRQSSILGVGRRRLPFRGNQGEGARLMIA